MSLIQLRRRLKADTGGQIGAGLMSRGGLLLVQSLGRPDLLGSLRTEHADIGRPSLIEAPTRADALQLLEGLLAITACTDDGSIRSAVELLQYRIVIAIKKGLHLAAQCSKVFGGAENKSLSMR